MRYPRMWPYKHCDAVYAVGGVRRSHPFDSAVYAVLGPSGTVLIDCGSPYGFEYKEKNLKKIGSEIGAVELVIGTHSHYDHLGGFAELKRRNPSVRLAVHEADRAAVETGDPDLTCAGWMFQDVFEPAAVDVVLHGGERIEAGGLEFEIIHTPGHSPGSITVVCEAGGKNIAFPGDSYVPSCTRVGYDYDLLLETYERLLDLRVDIVCPGHLGHLISFPVTQVMKNRFAVGVVRALVGFDPLMKAASAVNSYIYENSNFLGGFANKAKEM